MKTSVSLLAIMLFVQIAISQIPNGNFEEWTISNNIEDPIDWQTNNSQGFIAVQKTTDALEGNYSMKVSSTAFGIEGTSPGWARVKFLPQAAYQYLNADVRIDSVEMGSVAIVVSEQAMSAPLFEPIAQWFSEVPIVGVAHVSIPIAGHSLDTLMIEIFANNSPGPIFTIGYAEVIIDNLVLSVTSSTKNLLNDDKRWTIYPNPTKDFISFQFDGPIRTDCVIKLLNLQGNIIRKWNLQGAYENNLFIGDLIAGAYIIEFWEEDAAVQRTKIIKQ